MRRPILILGAGVTGLAAGMTTGCPVYEAENWPGGICSSYYIQPNSKKRSIQAPQNGEAYRFEIGGGHWIFGGDSRVLKWINRFAPVKKYSRRSSVYFCKNDLYVPYPIQNNLRFLRQEIANQSIREMSRGPGDCETMKAWLGATFGKTLSDLFFNPFHQLYTANLYERIAPQDAQKSPVNIQEVIRGAKGKAAAAGYNVTFVYPKDGLNILTQQMARKCNVCYGKRVVQIDVHKKIITFLDGTNERYEKVLSTLPLKRMMELTGLTTDEEPFPYTSVLVLNIGAVRGAKCPKDHWLYNPDAQSGFHRVGFYSNVDLSFLPKSARATNNRVSIYVERSFVGGVKPSDEETARYVKSVIMELQQWEFIGQVEVVDPTWIDVAYTWAWPGSKWKETAIKKLEEYGIRQLGRYGRWSFQGIAASINEGLLQSCAKNE
jgi:protoporphyrinogen oxidase